MGRLTRGVHRLAVAAVVAVASGGCAAPDGALPDHALPAGAAAADSIVRDWVETRRVPGAVLLVSRHGEIEVFRAYGNAMAMHVPDATLGDGPVGAADRQEAPSPVALATPVPMTPETVFDLASVTKVMATTMAVMLLVDRGELDLDAPVSRYLPDFTGGAKGDITPRHLLTHRSGLSQWQPTYYHASSADEAYAWIRDFPLAWPVGEARHYSDLGFMVLGRVVEAVAGDPLDAWLTRELYLPLGLAHTRFRPAPTVDPFAATSHGNPFERRMVHDPDFGYRIDIDPDSWSGWRAYTLAGEVNDGNAHHAFGGVAGHAGLFSTAGELHTLLRLLLDGGTHGGTRVFASGVVDTFLQSSGDGQALGWQLPDYASPGAFAHTGFTGTFVLGDPTTGTAVVLLTNRQNHGVDASTSYPDVGPLQRAVAEAVTRD